MNIDFSVKQIQSNIQIVGESNYKDYNQCVTLNLLIDSNNKIVMSCINTHDGIDESLFQNVKDGWYKVYHIIIPKVEYIPTEYNILFKYDNLFYYKDGYIYKYIIRGNVLQDIELSELLKDCDSNITTSQQNIFIYSTLETCLKSYILASNGNINIENTSVPECSECRKLTQKQIIKVRDYLNMLLEIIKHYIQCNNYSSAQEILSLVKNYCNVREKNN